MFKGFPYILVVDLEATCCDRQSIRRQEMEIIEIGAVMVDSQSLEPVDEFQTFVRPVRNPRLTPFCTQLTSITQTMVDTAPGLPEALSAFKNWLSGYPGYLFTSWGDYDKNQFTQDCRYHQQPWPFAGPHLNIKVQFSKAQNLRKRHGMAGALRIAGLDLSGTHHRGIDDARNMVRLLPYITGRKMLSA